jgi:hypothetical protein
MQVRPFCFSPMSGHAGGAHSRARFSPPVIAAAAVVALTVMGVARANEPLQVAQGPAAA